MFAGNSSKCQFTAEGQSKVLWCDGGMREAMRSAEESLRASRTACGASQSANYSSPMIPSRLQPHVFASQAVAQQKTHVSAERGGNSCPGSSFGMKYYRHASTSAQATPASCERAAAGKAALRSAREDMAAAIEVLGHCRQRLSPLSLSPLSLSPGYATSPDHHMSPDDQALYAF